MDTSGQNRPRRIPDAAPSTPLYASIAKTCEVSGLSRSRIYELIAAGRISAVKDGARTLVSINSVLAFLRALPPLRPSRGSPAGVASGC